jgi:hypothetical protein
MRGASGQQRWLKQLAYFEVLFYPSPPNLELAYMKKRRRKRHNLGYIRVIRKAMLSWACVAPLV